ncbi:hypothetical protein PENTCL1PPCAC_25122, partial [Pristionchus entomophagus]
PINSRQVQVFVTANTDLAPSGSAAVEVVSEVQLRVILGGRNVEIFKCSTDGEIKINNADADFKTAFDSKKIKGFFICLVDEVILSTFHFFITPFFRFLLLEIDHLNSFAVESSEEKLYLGALPKDILQCNSVIFETDDDSILRRFFADSDTTWILHIVTKKVADDAPGDIIFTDGKVKGEEDLFNKMTCNHKNLVIENKVDTPKVTYKEVKLESCDEDKKVLKEAELPFYMRKVTNNLCENNGFNMAYSIKLKETDTEPKTQGVAKKIECQIKSDSPAIPPVWQYAITLTNNKTVWAEPTEIVEVECLQYKCRTCEAVKTSSQGISCPRNMICVKPDFDAPTIDHTYESLKKCYSLKTDSKNCSVIKLNDENFEKSKINTPTICEGGKFVYNQHSISTLTCAPHFDWGWSKNIMKYDMIKDEETRGKIEKLVQSEEATEPVNCHYPIYKCKCIKNDTRLHDLAISNQNGANWLRVNSLDFDINNNTWIYSRQNAENQMISQELGADRIARCISCVRCTEDEMNEQTKARLASKLKVKVNPSSTIVYVVNIVLIVVFFVFSVPFGHFFVTSRIKKREALKAAKKDKKKEDKKEEQSGDKKSDEKKNEA